jgi:hypothetical protein
MDVQDLYASVAYGDTIDEIACHLCPSSKRQKQRRRSSVSRYAPANRKRNIARNHRDMLSATGRRWASSLSLVCQLYQHELRQGLRCRSDKLSGLAIPA